MKNHEQVDINDVVECIKSNSDSMGVSYLQPGMHFIGNKDIGFWGYNNPKFPVFLGDGVFPNGSENNLGKLIDMAISRFRRNFAAFYTGEKTAELLSSQGFSIVPFSYEIVFSIKEISERIDKNLSEEIMTELRCAERSGFCLSELKKPKNSDIKHISEINHDWLARKRTSKSEMRGNVRPFLIDDHGLVRTFWLQKNYTREDLFASSIRPRLRAFGKMFAIKEDATPPSVIPKKKDFGYVQLDPYFSEGSLRGYYFNLVRACRDQSGLNSSDPSNFGYYLSAFHHLVKQLRSENVYELNIGPMPFHKEDVLDIHRNYHKKFGKNSLGLGYIMWFVERGNDLYGYASLNKEKELLRKLPGVRLKPLFFASKRSKSLRTIVATHRASGLPLPSIGEFLTIGRTVMRTVLKGPA